MKELSQISRRLRVLWAVAALLLASCGGGSGGNVGSDAGSTGGDSPGGNSGTAPAPTAAPAPTDPAASASASQCPEHFALATPPAITRTSLQAQTRELCYEAFAVLHSGVSRTPVYAAEHLTRAGLASAAVLDRVDSFHAEGALPADERAELADYVRSGYDRGHMAPNADMPTRTAQAQSFTLANMVPQLHSNNAGIWSGMEDVARRLATNEGEVYVVSGPAFLGSEVKQIGGRVLVPTHLWKVIYRPATQQAGAYVIRNDDMNTYQVLSITALAQAVGVDVLPSLPAVAREAPMSLPRPTSNAMLVTQLP